MNRDVIKEQTVDRLQVRVFRTRQEMGENAGEDAANRMRELLRIKPTIRMVFAAAPSQHEFLQVLADSEGIDWSRVEVFHMDEYLGLPEHSTERFGHFLTKHLFEKVRPGKVHLIDGSASSVREECERYAGLLSAAEIDIVCLGIGENGHLAFNDPPADFDESALIKRVELDEACRRQQVNDGCFPSLDEVPTHALSLTIPALMSGASLLCIVPGPRKRAAVARTLTGEIAEDCPATALRRHPSCILYVDEDSYGVGDGNGEYTNGDGEDSYGVGEEQSHGVIE
ncbi:glucosamine-6-phosphate deaminase [Cohnella fermenti]|uniref:Glucosamine-6-phosphate deaminase n=1 Tax=Cohnella fermenti TaxID=2565925 RepID=A0A4S4BGP2_9BACL|nr:glucosamine-6-phosphate deaminase [Cohnella fermenti]THF73411.1 glucosamine-6-phosphate deaminase [Cohnella fermenti]